MTTSVASRHAAGWLWNPVNINTTSRWRCGPWQIDTGGGVSLHRASYERDAALAELAALKGES